MAWWDRRARAALLTVVVLVLSSCGDDPVSSELAALVGTWNATMARFTNRENPDQSIDVVQELSAVVTMEFHSDGRAVLTLVAFGGVNVQSGHARIEGSDLVLVPDDPSLAEERFRYEVNGSELILDGELDWDFNLDGTPEPAFAHIVLVRH